MFSPFPNKWKNSRRGCCADRDWISALIFLTAIGSVTSAEAQRPRVGDSYVIPEAQMNPPVIGTVLPPGYPGSTMPQATPPPPVYPPTAVPNTMGAPQSLPIIPSPYPPGGMDPSLGTSPSLIQPPTYGPYSGDSSSVPGMPPPIIPYSSQPTQPPQFIYPPPATPYAAAPPPNNSMFDPAWAQLQAATIYRLAERPRWRQTYISRSGDGGLGLNESDFATTFNCPNFLGSTQPLRISPGFAIQWWDGPNTPVTGADLPPRTYSVYLANDYSSPWTQKAGFDFNLTVGLYSDFDEVNSDSVRVGGLALGWYRFNNATTFKLGIEYLDRVRVKILPAGGFFLYPNPDFKIDLYFPRPKIAYRCRNLGLDESWIYLGGEYGGGSWTVKRIDDTGDQADVNDIRVFVGLESAGPTRITGFFDVGYVFNREIVYRSNSSEQISIDDGVMLRAGVAF